MLWLLHRDVYLGNCDSFLTAVKPTRAAGLGLETLRAGPAHPAWSLSVKITTHSLKDLKGEPRLFSLVVSSHFLFLLKFNICLTPSDHPEFVPFPTKVQFGLMAELDLMHEI